MARPKTDEIWPISASSVAPDLSAAIFRPAGYKAAGTGALANPSALSNFADSSCYAVQFSQRFLCCQNS